jgi:small-conductance mechanosensitive channel
VEEQEQENVKLAEKLNQATSEGQQLRKENEKYKQNLGKVYQEGKVIKEYLRIMENV